MTDYVRKTVECQGNGCGNDIPIMSPKGTNLLITRAFCKHCTKNADAQEMQFA